jgi:HD-like signal output (HDOD) protein
MATRADLLVKEVEQLLTLPSTYIEIRRVIDSPESGIIDAAKVIAMDAALTARLLRIVNSPMYAQTRPVETVTRAVSMLGMNQVHDLCLAVSLASCFERIHPELMDMEQYWHDSLTRAIAARALASHCGIYNRERLFVLGLLSDIGHMVMYMRIPDAAAKLVRIRETGDEPMHVIERRHLECDYAEVGGALLRRWRLPASIYLPIEQQSDPRHGQDHEVESAILHVVEAGMRIRTVKRDASHFINEDARALCEIDSAALSGVISESSRTAHGMVAMFAVAA